MLSDDDQLWRKHENTKVVLTRMEEVTLDGLQLRVLKYKFSRFLFGRFQVTEGLCVCGINCYKSFVPYEFSVKKKRGF
jgi:hypothetical protein